MQHVEQVLWTITFQTLHYIYRYTKNNYKVIHMQCVPRKVSKVLKQTLDRITLGKNKNTLGATEFKIMAQ